MKVLYLECKMGAAGDMLMAALSELTDQKAFLEKMKGLGLEGLEIQAEPSVKCGIHGTHMKVTVSGEEETSEAALRPRILVSGGLQDGTARAREYGQGRAMTTVITIIMCTAT